MDEESSVLGAVEGNRIQATTWVNLEDMVLKGISPLQNHCGTSLSEGCKVLRNKSEGSLPGNGGVSVQWGQSVSFAR